MPRGPNERAPLLRDAEAAEDNVKIISFEKDDPDDPRNWSRRRKMTNVAVIAFMAVLSPLASSMFTPAMEQMADSLGTTPEDLVSASSSYVIVLGIGPLILAPLSETFGRRVLYMVCFGVFTLLQIPTALSPNLGTLLACRTLAGFFGSVGIANGGGTINDMFQPEERAAVFGWYLLGPLMGPTLGPLIGGLIVEFLDWRWMFWFLALLCAINTSAGYFFLAETYPPTILQARCQRLQHEQGGRYTYADSDDRPLPTKLASSLWRPLRILITQPIVLVMASYQAAIFAVMYSLYTNMQAIFGSAPYSFSSLQVGLMYLGPGLGFFVAVRFLVPHVDTIYVRMARKRNVDPQPEFRLPLANIGAVLLPVTLLWFAWSVEAQAHWAVPLAAMPFFGVAQVSIFNTVQNYYIDAFSKYAASAIAAGAMFRSVVGGVVPLFAPALFDELGYGWGWSVFALVALLLAPSPLLFMRYGAWLRERFAVEL